MLLSDRSIREAIKSGRIIIDPWDESLLQPASVCSPVPLGFRRRVADSRTNIVATMLAGGECTLLTFNTTDFRG